MARKTADDAAIGYMKEIDAVLQARLGDRDTRVSQKTLDDFAAWPADRLDRYTLYENYYDGEQQTMLTDRQKQYLQRNKVEWSENFAEIVIDSAVERLMVIGVTTSLDIDTPKPTAPLQKPPMPFGSPAIAFRSADDQTTAPVPVEPPVVLPKPSPEPDEPEMDLGSWLWEKVWDGSQGDQLGIEVHTSAIKLGDAFILVDFDTDTNKVRMTLQPPDVCRIEYRNRVKMCAVKKWYDTTVSPTNPRGERVCRMNLYFPDRIEKWFRLHDGIKSQGGWVEWLDDGDETWPTPWTDEAGDPIGIPVFHFANKPRANMYGMSDLRGVIPQQDLLNKEILDLANVLDNMGAPQRYTTGLDDVSGLKSVPGEIWNAPSPDAKFGQFEAADPSGALESIQSTLLRLATRSKTPAHLLYTAGASLPSGEAMKTAEAGLVTRVEFDQVFFGNQWNETLRMGARLAFIFGEGEMKPPIKNLEDLTDASINTKWKEAESRNEKEHLETLQIMLALGIPEEEIWSRIDGIDVEAMKEAKARKDVENAITMRAAFDRGGDTNPAEPGQVGFGGGPIPPRPGGPFGAN